MRFSNAKAPKRCCINQYTIMVIIRNGAYFYNMNAIEKRAIFFSSVASLKKHANFQFQTKFS